MPTSAARIAGIDLAQSILYPSDDSELVLVAGKDVLVKVNVITTNPAQANPAGSLLIENSSGLVLKQIALTKPSAALAATVPATPDFTHFYTAVVPASSVSSGLRLVASLENGQAATTINPRVGASNPITLVEIPVQIAGTTGVVYANGAKDLLQRAPVSAVTLKAHATYTSTKVTVLPTTDDQWSEAFNDIVGEIADLHTSENASNRTYYFGFLPKRTWGLMGLGWIGGNGAVGADMKDNPDVISATMVHEVGHNFSLAHAPCGGASDADLLYPYPNANLGGTARYRWGYTASTSSFTDPHDTNLHDIMSYCTGATYSDYNYRLVQKYMTPADARVVAAQVAVSAPVELLLISGRIEAGKSELRPLKSFQGTAKLPASGAYLLRIVSDSGTVEYPFATQKLDHRAGAEAFSFSIPNPGTVSRVTILLNAQVILDKSAAASSSATSAANKLAASRVSVTATEAGGRLALSWDAVKYPYLSVTQVGEQRSTLALDLTGGIASLPLTNVPAGGTFEFILSDGMNSVRLQQQR